MLVSVEDRFVDGSREMRAAEVRPTTCRGTGLTCNRPTAKGAPEVESETAVRCGNNIVRKTWRYRKPSHNGRSAVGSTPGHIKSTQGLVN